MPSTVLRAACVVIVASLAVANAVAAPTPSPAPGPVDRLTKADNARARSTVLRARDVFSNFTRDRSLSTAPTITHCDGYPGDRSGITVTGQARSAFKLRSYSIGSTALWFETTADANRYWTTTVRPQYVRCLAKGLRLTRNGESVTPRIVKAGRIALQPTGADKAVAFQVIGSVPGTPGMPGNDGFNWIETAVFVKEGRGIALLRTIWINDPCDCYHELSRLLAQRLGTAR